MSFLHGERLSQHISHKIVVKKMNTIGRMYNMVLLVKFIYSLIMLILIISLKMLNISLLGEISEVFKFQSLGLFHM